MNEKAGAIIIGAGLAGLTAAYQLQKKGVEVRVLESAPVVGGVIRSLSVDGFELDLGPNSLVLTPSLEKWMIELGLDAFRLDASAAGKHRFLVKDKTLHALSPHPVKLLKSPYLSWGAKVGILTERFRAAGVPAASAAGVRVAPAAGASAASVAGEETVAAFFTRRFGKEVTAAIADPIFSGIYAGDIHQLSIREVMPKMVAWEKEYGSLTKAALKNKAAMKGGRAIVSFTGGLGRLTDALAAPLGERVRTGVRVTEITTSQDDLTSHDEPAAQVSPGAGYSVTYFQDGTERTLSAPYLIYTAPLHTLASIPWFAPVKQASEAVVYAPVRTLHLAVSKDGLDLPPAFGFLAPSREHLSILGCIFTSAIFPSKAPEGYALLTVMLGGAHQGADLLRDEDGFQAAAIRDLKEILHISSDIRVLHGETWTKAIPQKNIGYGEIKESLLVFQGAHPGFFFGGNGVSGVSVGDTMDYAADLIQAISGSL